MGGAGATGPAAGAGAPGGAGGVDQALKIADGRRSNVSCWIFCSRWVFLAASAALGSAAGIGWAGAAGAVVAAGATGTVVSAVGICAVAVRSGARVMKQVRSQSQFQSARIATPLHDQSESLMNPGRPAADLHRHPGRPWALSPACLASWPRDRATCRSGSP